MFLCKQQNCTTVFCLIYQKTHGNKTKQCRYTQIEKFVIQHQGHALSVKLQQNDEFLYYVAFLHLISKELKEG